MGPLRSLTLGVQGSVTATADCQLPYRGNVYHIGCTAPRGERMTVVAGVSTLTEAFVVADTRLSAGQDAQGRPLVVRDFCQKLVSPNAWSLIGFAGQLCLARYLM